MHTGDTNYIYKNDLDKAYFQHNIPYDNDKYFFKRTDSDKALRYDGYERGLAK